MHVHQTAGRLGNRSDISLLFRDEMPQPDYSAKGRGVSLKREITGRHDVLFYSGDTIFLESVIHFIAG